VQFRILGPLEIESANGRIELGSAKQRALLALLLLNANDVVPTSRLIDVLWADELPADGSKALQVHVSRLRRSFVGEDVVETRPGGYLLAADASSFDLPRFQERAAAGRALLAAGDARGARSALADALRLWRGTPLAEFSAEAFAQTEIARLDELRLAAVEDRIDADLRLAAHAEVVAELEALTAQHPLRERLRAQHMLALYRSGRQADALQAYRDARGALVDELGIEPGKQLQELEQAILRQDASLDLAPEAPAARAGRRAAGAFVGRDAELAELGHTLDDAVAGRGRLFLVSGESGVGKTRLADELASRAKEAGMTILWGRSPTLGGAPAYWPWAQAFRGLGADAPPLDGAADDEARFRLFTAVTDALRTASAKRPLLIVLDDAHRGDDQSLLLLDFLAGEVAELHVALLATFVDDEETPAGLASLADHSAHHRLRLRPLTVEAVAALLALAGAADVDAEALHAETGGNPRLVWHAVR
jgi:DNA-binding SARP family transcriptional activator